MKCYAHESIGSVFIFNVSRFFCDLSLTGDETDVFVRFKFSGDVMSLVIPVFMGLILYRESNNELRILLDLKS